MLIVRTRSVLRMHWQVSRRGSEVRMIAAHRRACTRCNCPVAVITGAKQHRRGCEPLHRKGKGQQTHKDDAQAMEHDESVEHSVGEKFHHDMTL